MDDSKLIFTNCYYNGERFALLWFDERDRMLLTNGYDAVYEGHFKIEARQKMLGNIAKSLLEHKWRKILNEEALLITRIDNDTLTLSYVLEDICLTKVTKNIQERIRFILYSIMDISKQKTFITKMPSETVLSAPRKRTVVTPKIQKTVKKRKRAVDLVFSD